MIEPTGFVARELERLVMFSIGSGFYRLKQLALMLAASLYDKEVANFNDKIIEFIPFVSPNTKATEQYLKREFSAFGNGDLIFRPFSI